MQFMTALIYFKNNKYIYFDYTLLYPKLLNGSVKIIKRFFLLLF